MEKEFVPYAEALALKELGFDEECFSYVKHLGYDKNKDKVQILSRVSRSQIEDSGLLLLKIPTFSQAFRWFREKYDIDITNHLYNTNKGGDTREYQYEINLSYGKPIKLEPNPYEEAELECLKKLIEIVKEKFAQVKN
jgi:hypothetical protein